MSTTLATPRGPTWPPPALDPAGPFAAPLAEITWVMIALGVTVALIVFVLLAIALRGDGPNWLRRNRVVVIGGFAFPVVVLSAALVYGLTTTARLTEPPGADELRIRVVGEMWWWRVIYFDAQSGAPLFETANEIRIPANRPVTLELESADVIHSLWAPRLGAKLDMIPGRRNILRIQADEPGIYRGHCAEFCGLAHALMAFEIHAVDDEAFAAWLTAQGAPAAAQADARSVALFSSVGCAACHAIRGSGADGRAGPDLTHFASRRTLGAGILHNEPQVLRAWIADAHALKPGVRMPPYDTIPERDREALALYLEGLR